MKIPTKQLLGVLAAVKPVARARSVGDSSGLVRVEAHQGSIYITAACIGETVIWMCRKMDVEGDIKPTCVRFDYLLNALADAEETTIDQAVEGNMLKITSGGRVTRLSCVSVDNFPTLPDLASMKSNGIPESDLRDGMLAVAGFEHDKMERPELANMHILASPKLLLCETAHGTNACKFERPLKCPEMEFQIPGTCCNHVIAALSEANALLVTSDKAVAVTHANGWIWCPMYADAKFPSTSAIYNPPDGIVWLGEIETGRLKAELELAIPYFDPQKTQGITLRLDGEGIHAQVAGLNSDIAFSYAGNFGAAEFRAHCGSLIRCLTQIKATKCKLGASQAAIFLATDEIVVGSCKMLKS